MAQTETQVVATELERVREKIPVAFERDDTFYSTVDKRPAEIVSNRDMRIPIEIRPGGRFGHWNPAGGDLGRGDGNQYEKAVINPVHLKLGVEYQTLADMATDNRRKAIVSNVRKLLATSMAEFRRQLDALCMTDGTGVLATVSAVSNAGGKDTVTCATAGDGFGVRLLRYGQFLSRYDTTLATRTAFTGSATVGGEAPIDLYDPDNNQVRFNGESAGFGATDKLVVSGLTATPPASLYGVPYHHSNASTGTWLGFNRADYPEIRANRVTAGGALALTHPRLLLNKIGNRIGLKNGMKIEAWMHPCQVQAYEQLGQAVSVIQKQARDESLNLYFDQVQMAGVSVRQSFAWDKTRIDFVNKETWGRAVMKEAGFYEVEGRRLFEVRGSDGGVSASTIFYLVVSLNLFVDNPAACGYISGLSIPTGYNS